MRAPVEFSTDVHVNLCMLRPSVTAQTSVGVQFSETLSPKVKAPRAVSRSPQKICGYNYYLGEGFLAPLNATRLLNNDWLKKERIRAPPWKPFSFFLFMSSQ